MGTVRAVAGRIGIAGALVALCLGGCGSSAPPPGLTDLPADGGPGTSLDVTTLPDGELPPRAAAGYPGYDLTVVLPYNGPEQNFDIATQALSARLDVHISVDTTGSFMPEIQTIQRELVGTVVPGLRSRVADLAMGISRFADFPVQPHGRPTDHLYDLLTPVTTDFARVNAAVVRLLPLQDGEDIPEGWDEALYQIATGAGFRANGVTYAQPFSAGLMAPGGGIAGGVGFRANAARVVINVTDAPAHEPEDYLPDVSGVHGTAAVGAALAGVGARFIGIAANTAPRPQMEALAMATSAWVPPDTTGTCPMGIHGSPLPPTGGRCPLVFDILPDGTGLSETLVDAIASFLDHQAYAEVHGQAVEDTHGFVQAVEATTATVPAGVTPPGREDRYPTGIPDGVLDTFTGVPTRTMANFRVHLRNTRAMTQEYPQLYFVQVQILGDGVLLAQRTVRVIVPEGPKPDSGRDVPTVDMPSDIPVTGTDAALTD